MRGGLVLGLIVVVGIIAAFAFGLIDINQTRETKLPEIKAEGGQMPGFDVKTADVKMGTSNTSIEVPKVKTEKETIAVPTIDVQKAK